MSGQLCARLAKLLSCYFLSCWDSETSFLLCLSIFTFKVIFSYCSVFTVRSLLSGAAGCALPRMRTTARPSGCVRAAAAAPPSGCTRSVCSAGLTRNSGATAQLASPAHSAMLNTSLSFPNWVGEISSIFKSWWAWNVNKLECFFYRFLNCGWLKRQFSGT